MFSMFNGCSAFNQPLTDWVVNSVVNISGMFYGCSSFNQPLNTWRTPIAVDMSSMFRECSVFNQPLTDWVVDSVVNMSNMFRGCSSFNQPLTTWRTPRLTNMSYMFDGCTSFNQNLSGFHVQRIIHREHAFDNTPIENNIDFQPHFGQRVHNQNQFVSYSRVRVTPIRSEIGDPSILSESAFDVINVDNYIVRDHLQETASENPNDRPIIFKQGNSVTTVTRTSLNQMIQSNENSIIKYECKQEYTFHNITANELVTPIIPYFSNRSIGLSGLTPLSQIKYIMTHPEIVIVYLVEVRNVPATVSYGVITRRTNVVSATHCQAGTNETIYDMIDITSSIGELSTPVSTQKIDISKGRKKHKKTKKSNVRKTMKKRKSTKTRRRRSRGRR